MPHGHGVNLGDRDLYLCAARTDASGCVLGQPSDDLLRSRVLRRVVCGRDIGVQFRRERP
jgi:hypothetical protein